MKNASFIFDPIFYIFNTMPQVGWDRTGWEAFKYMLFDPDNGTILTRCNLKYKGKYKYTSKLKSTNLFGRTPLSWLKITVFYIIYYTLLACFWIACLVIFFQVFISYWLLPLSNILYLPSQSCSMALYTQLDWAKSHLVYSSHIFPPKKSFLHL